MLSVFTGEYFYKISAIVLYCITTIFQFLCKVYVEGFICSLWQACKRACLFASLFFVKIISKITWVICVDDSCWGFVIATCECFEPVQKTNELSSSFSFQYISLYWVILAGILIYSVLYQFVRNLLNCNWWMPSWTLKDLIPPLPLERPSASSSLKIVLQSRGVHSCTLYHFFVTIACVDNDLHLLPP